MDKYNDQNQFPKNEDENEQSQEAIEPEQTTIYDNQKTENVEQQQESETKNKQQGDQAPVQEKKRRNWLTPILLGIIIGILLTTFALPALVDSGFISTTGDDVNSNDGANTTTGDKEGNTSSKNVHVDVSSQVTEIVEDVLPAVVGVTNIQHQADFWRQQSENEAGTGSGVIYKTDDEYAYIITNHHVIERADLIEVVLSDETTVEADLLGSDIFTDLAVLRIDGSNIDKVIERGSSDNLKVGEPAIAIGNPLGHMFSGSVTQGVISGTQRTIPLDINQDGRADWQAEVIQTDAAINPGNSGGALINMDGQLIGINSMKINQSSVEGIGFAIPIDTAWPIIQELEETGEVTRPYIGIELYSLDDVPRSEWSRTLKLPEDVEGGIYIWSVEPFSPADEAGLTRLDVITEIDGEKILGSLELRKVLYQEKEVGEEIDIVFYRDGERRETTVTLDSQ
ncbi:MAG TPA: S1C family serine protease [Bacillota bacterium]|nr:S1C family serine protease [Bacillota bacterium]